ncbi:dephospho-CoA kinase [Vagococcus humatus]|uniref:Dephospho-CoA kinase n=1 Tax=Vagococcus humatus TaxID=1889241 RepID=A0A3R9YL84_9ENTE|nr:dephospho-CoA kinase [Vagococcus humatus]RST90241.1 dephospho-CoA kinase [Vagococcus humatus]
MTFVLGLTGSIATGKSTVSRYFMAQGIPVVDADLIAREVVAPRTPGLEALVSHFGEGILTNDKELNRQALGQIVFSDKRKRAELDNLLEPFLRTGIKEGITAYVQTGVPLVVADIPLLFEKNYQEGMDGIMVVYLPEEVQLARLMKRDNLTLQQAQARISSQLSIEKKRQLADVVIDNSGTIAETQQQVLTWLNQGDKKSDLTVK